MIPMLRSAVRHLRSSMKAAAGVAVRYHAVIDGQVYELVAVPMRADSNQEDAEGLLNTDQAQDFKINIADLPVAPNHGDRLELVDDGLWFQLLHTGGGRESEQSGNYRDAWRLHCKEIHAPEDTTTAYGTSAGEGYGTPSDETYGRPRP